MEWMFRHESEIEEENEQIKRFWFTNGFLKPCRSLINFLSFKSLKAVYTILLSSAKLAAH